jgi:hypothetical protein
VRVAQFLNFSVVFAACPSKNTGTLEKIFSGGRQLTRRCKIDAIFSLYSAKQQTKCNKVCRQPVVTPNHRSPEGGNRATLADENDDRRVPGLGTQCVLCVSTHRLLINLHHNMLILLFFSFWRDCCRAYGLHLIEKGLILKAMTYLWSSNDINETIQQLCVAKFYREAYCVARLRKEDDDPVFADILGKWSQQFENNGALEAAATM